MPLRAPRRPFPQCRGWCPARPIRDPHPSPRFSRLLFSVRLKVMARRKAIVWRATAGGWEPGVFVSLIPFSCNAARLMAS